MKPRRPATKNRNFTLEQFTQNLNQLAKDGQIRSADRPPIRGGGHPDPVPATQEQPFCWWARPVWARRPLPRGWPGASPRRTRDTGRGHRLFAGHGALLAGTKYRGDFEQRLKGVLKSLGQAARHFVHRRDPPLIGAGAASGGTLDASNLLKPGLSSGPAACIGATTFTEYRGILKGRGALSRRFQKVDVVGPADQTSASSKGLKSRFEEHHSVKYALAALQAAANSASTSTTATCPTRPST